MKAIKLLAIILVCMMLTSCGNDAVTTSNNTTTVSTKNTTTSSTKTPPSPVSPPDFITSLKFENFDEAKKFVEKNDLSGYGEKDTAYIGKMLDAFYSAGYIILMKSDVVEVPTAISLKPSYEDTYSAVLYRKIYTEDNSFIVHIYHLDEEIIEKVKASDTDDFEAEFFKQSVYNNSEAWETIEYSGSNLGIATQLYISKTRSQFHFLLDERHYVVILTSETDKDDFVEFAKTLTFEKVPLEKAE